MGGTHLSRETALKRRRQRLRQQARRSTNGDRPTTSGLGEIQKSAAGPLQVLKSFIGKLGSLVENFFAWIFIRSGEDLEMAAEEVRGGEEYNRLLDVINETLDQLLVEQDPAAREELEGRRVELGEQLEAEALKGG